MMDDLPRLPATFYPLPRPRRLTDPRPRRLTDLDVLIAFDAWTTFIGVPPSARSMMRLLGFRSTNSACVRLRALRQRGWLCQVVPRGRYVITAEGKAVLLAAHRSGGKVR